MGNEKVVDISFFFGFADIFFYFQKTECFRQPWIFTA